MDTLNELWKQVKTVEKPVWNDWGAWPGLEHSDDSFLYTDVGSGIYVRPGCKLIVNRQSRVALRKNARLFVLGNFNLFGHDYITVDDGATVVLGNGYMNFWVMVESACGIIIGDAIIGPRCSIYDSDFHAVVDASGKMLNPPSPVRFGGHVWLADSVTVLKGATIGAGSCVGAKSLVIDDIPPNCMAAGSPARVIRTGITWM